MDTYYIIIRPAYGTYLKAITSNLIFWTDDIFQAIRFENLQHASLAAANAEGEVREIHINITVPEGAK